MVLDNKEWNDLALKDEEIRENFKSGEKEAIDDNKMGFGTAGIRGVFGNGLSKINYITISLAAYSYGRYLLENVTESRNKGVVIANDNRRHGNKYKEITSSILNGMGIKTYVIENDLMATPLLSYLIRNIGACGGINITASHNPKNYNGFKVYNSEGAQLGVNETKLIANIMDTVDPFNIKVGKYSAINIDKVLLEKYKNDVSKLTLNKVKNISVVYSPLHGTGYKIGKEIINKIGVEPYVVKNQSIVDPNFTNTKSPNPEDPKSYINGLKIMRKTKSDILVVTDPDSDRVGAVVKYKKRYKYLSGNDSASLYLEYKLSQLKEQGKLPKDGYVVKSLVSTDMAKKICKRYGVRIIEVQVGFKNIAEVIKKEKGSFILGFEESYGMLLNKDISRDKDAFQAMVGIIDMASYYKSMGLTLFDQLKNIQRKYGLYRNIQKSSKIDNASLKRVLNSLSKTKKIDDKIVAECVDYRKDKKNKSNMIKLIMTDGSWIVVRPSGTEAKVKYYIQTVGPIGSDELISNVISEKRLLNYIEDASEFIKPKEFSWKTVLKYSLFVAIMAGLLFMVFRVIYGQYSSSKDSATSQALDFYDTFIKWWFIGLVIAGFYTTIIGSWMKYRLLKFHKQNVKFRHLVISSIMGSIVSYLTPLAIGGDGIGYWYLRRKGFEKGPLAATFLTSTILWQIKNLVLTAVLLPMGIHMFKDLLINGNAETKTVLSIFIVGLVWDLFATIMIWTIFISRKFQNFIVSTSIKLLEWIPFIILSDPGQKASKYMTEFANIRQSMKKMWRNPLVMGEALFYEIIQKVVSISALIYMGMGIIKGDLEYGSYWSQIVATDVVNTANSFSLTPGSTGFVEFISLHIRDQIYIDHPITYSAKDVVINMDIINKITNQWPYLGLSALMAIFIIIGESRRKVHKINQTNKDTTFYKKMSFIWPLYISGWVTLIFLI